MSSYETADGRQLASVTTIISDCIDKSGALTQWAANCVCEWIRLNCDKLQPRQDIFIVTDNNLDEARKNFRAVSDTAKDVGTLVHRMIEMRLSGKPVDETDFTDEVFSSMSAYIDWEREHSLETIQTEMRVEGSNWCGTLDWYGKLDGKLTVIDFKTAKALYPESMGPQIAAYRSAVGAEASGILRLDKETGIPEYKDFSKRYESDLAIFMAMVNLYYLRHPKLAKKARMPF